MVKKLFEVSAIPASAFHQAMKAVIRPKTPAVLLMGTLIPPSTGMKCAMARSRKVMSRKKNKLKKARVDLRVQKRRIVVNTHQL